MIRIGTSGWVYKHWRGLLYPEGLSQRRWFATYAGAFDTVEINNTFYRLPEARTFDAWREQAPPGFLYALKANRLLTHYKKLYEPEQPLKQFLENAARLKATLGPVLYQLPPNWGLDLPRLEYFLALLPAGFQHVIEFRDQSWLVEEVFRLMERFGVSHCIHDKQSLQVPLRVTASPVYLRFHGDAQHGGDYPQHELEIWASRISSWQKEGLDVFAYFNNDWGGFALKNARTLIDIVS
jgi:uncharacterized protein YecE (DUF72 family)